MTKQDANDKLRQAQELIFEVEKEFPKEEFPRLHGYRARIALTTFQDNIGFTYATKDENLTNPTSVIS